MQSNSSKFMLPTGGIITMILEILCVDNKKTISRRLYKILIYLGVLYFIFTRKKRKL